MRRDDQEITDRLEIESILRSAIVCRIGLAWEDEPYVVPLCFGSKTRSFTFIQHLTGKKSRCLKKSPVLFRT